MMNIDASYVKPCQEIVQRATKKKQIKVTVNWKNINSKLDEDKKRMAFICLNNQAMWKHLGAAVEKFCFADKKNSLSFASQIKYIGPPPSPSSTTTTTIIIVTKTKKCKHNSH